MQPDPIGQTFGLSQLAIDPFKPAFPWLGGDLQTVRSTLVKTPEAPTVTDRLLVELYDGSGALNCAVSGSENADIPLLLVHGLGGHEDSVYMMKTARFFSDQGWRTYRMNYRGVGPSRKTSTVPYSAGLTDDIRAACKAIKQREGKAPFVIGFSLGGQMILRTLGEDGTKAGDYCAGAVSVSAPLDLEKCVQQMERARNRPYHQYLVKQMRRDLESGFGDKVNAVNSIRAIDDQLIAPAFGFEGAEDYYQKVACGSVINGIKVPTLMIHAADDPWIPANAYRMVDKTLEAKSKEVLRVLVTNSGGHVGFFDRNLGEHYISAIALKFYTLVYTTFIQSL